MKTIWVIGSLNVDLVVRVQRFPNPGETLTGTAFETHFGGKGGNQAMALARLGANPCVAGCIGNDNYGLEYKNSLSAAGADIKFLSLNGNVPTGTALIEVDETGQNRIVIIPGANGTVTTKMIQPVVSHIQQGDIVLVQLEVPLETVWNIIAAAHLKQATIILDPAPAAEIPINTYPQITWITPNEHEAQLLTGQDTSTMVGIQKAGEALLSWGVQNVIIKAGGNGAVLFEQNHMAIHGKPQVIPGFLVDVVDTTAAGDTFNGAFAWGLALGDSPFDSVQKGNAAAALSVTGKGAQGAMPTKDRVLELLTKNN